MAFRRKGFRRMRRRRRPPETYTKIACFGCENIYHNATCNEPIIDVIELLTMRTPRNQILDTTELAAPSNRALTVKGISFQLEYDTNPDDWQVCAGARVINPTASGLTFFLHIWEAIVVLPLQQGTFLPSYLPSLSSATLQSGDTADRLLWKRHTLMPLWGRATTGASQLEGTMRDEGHGPVRVKSKVRLDDRHGLFLVRNYVHNVVIATSGDPGFTCDSQTDCDNFPEWDIVPINHHLWMKLYYNVS